MKRLEREAKWFKKEAKYIEEKSGVENIGEILSRHKIRVSNLDKFIWIVASSNQPYRNINSEYDETQKLNDQNISTSTED
jgi:hypothetical protein